MSDTVHKYIKLAYPDYLTLRALLQDLNESDFLEDRLNTEESTVLVKIDQIIAAMEKAREEEKDGTRKVIYERGRRRVIRTGVAA